MRRTWASILLQSVSYGQFYGITGSYWYSNPLQRSTMPEPLTDAAAPFTEPHVHHAAPETCVCKVLHRQLGGHITELGAGTP